MAIDEFLESHGFVSHMGYLGEIQGQQFAQRLSELPDIRSIAEIGFNAGHSAECFFQHCSTLERFVTFDHNTFPYTKPAAEYLETLYKDRFLLVEGNSLQTVPEFSKNFPTQKFDLIYIDGCHVFEYVVDDLLNSQNLAHPNTILWIDDYNRPGVRQAINFYKKLNRIRIRKIFSPKDVNDPKRTWIEAKYR